MSEGSGRGKDAGAKKRITNIIQITRKGVGYLPFPVEEAAKKTQEDIEVQTEQLLGALNGDTVEVELTGLFPRPKGKVVKVVERVKDEFVATIKGNKAIAADARFYRPITIVDGQQYDENQKVVVKLVSFDGTKDPTATVIKHLGNSGEHRVEMNAIVLEHGFDTSFPPEVEAEAAEIEKNHASIIASEIPKRLDFRDSTTFTIDPKDAKDFDDAISVEVISDDEYEIGIHIADATYFCAPGTAIDAEAVKRGTSVYLVDATIPMLPHALSGNVCSLKEAEDRLAFSAIVRMNKKGHVLERKFAKSVIRSNKRFTYEEAQEILNKEEGPFVTELLILRDLARAMRKQREHEGAIDFGDNEVRFTLDAEGKPLSVVRKERIETNLLIEEFMLLANREVSTYVSKLAKEKPEKGYIFLYRIHDKPKEDRVADLTTFAHAMGYDFAHKRKANAKDIQKLLKDIEGKPEERLIRTATLRSMAKAIYSTKNIGHFGLSFEYYSHFTSPIRRYPDMLAHRILFSHLNGTPITRQELSNLERMCINASAQEARAVDAERESIKYKQVEFMMGKIGQTFEGTISGVTDWGIYVEEDNSAAEGLVRVRTLGDDFYNYSAKDYALVGERKKQKFALGDRVRMKLVAADLAARTLDFELVR